MADVFTPQKRSWVMSRIKGKNTKIDLKMKNLLSGLGCRYTMYPKMFGNPDFALKRKRIVIFCDGDFWHGYKYYKRKRLRKKFWRDKIEGNMRRDRAVTKKLRAEGWSVLRFWEHDIQKNPEKCLRKIIKKIESN